MSYSDDLEKGILAENIIEEMINDERGFYCIKYVSYDENGNVTWQNVDTRYGKIRHPDFNVYSSESNEFVLLVEVKSLAKEYKNKFGYIEDLEKNDKDSFLVAEKVKIDDYVLVQSHYETECKVVFVIGGDDEEKRFYWDTLDNLRNNYIAVGRPYGKNSPLCYLWSISDVWSGLNGLIK
jgi:hypothetical protein